MSAPVGLTNYFKTALLNRWNLLAVSGGLCFALLSGFPEVLLPLLLAAEIGYVAFRGAHPKFQAYVDAQEAARQRKAGSETSAQTLQKIMQVLPKPSLTRFEQLRTRCLDLRQIARELKQSDGADPRDTFDSFQIAGLDKLLWIFLRLLYTQFALAKFLEKTSVERIQTDIHEMENRLAQVPVDAAAPHTQKIRRTLEDNLQTCKDRLANFQKAQENHELVGLEIDRLENKIRTLAELAVNRQEPDFITGQVDQVAGSMLETEKTMNELQFATDLGPLDEEVPELVAAKQVHYII
jgi:hypothetical protein